MTLELSMRRTWLTPTTTISPLWVAGAPECFILEDKRRAPGEPKVYGQTAIPEGRYEIIINRSERFSKLAGHDVFLPLLLDVPGFAGVRIHPGNGPKDTDGCLLPGRIRTPDNLQVLESRLAFEPLFAKLKAYRDRMFLTIGLL